MALPANPADREGGGIRYPEGTLTMRRLAPAFALFFLAPLVAEFFLGDFPITLIFLIVPLATMYGAGALLIREVARRTGRGWPTIVTLALAFGVFEEALLTQSLFNPDYADAHLLDDGFITPLGIAIPWTIFVLALHTVWSISTPIALVEESTARSVQPWYRAPGLIVTIGVFVAGSAFTFAVSYGDRHYLASTPKLLISAVIVLGLVAVALLWPRPTAPTATQAAPRPRLVFGATIIAGIVFMGSEILPVWPGVAAMVVALIAIGNLIARWSQITGWGPWHRFAAAAGALLTYSWHGFTMTPVEGKGVTINLISHVVYAIGALAILWVVAAKIRAHSAEPAATEVTALATA